MSASTCLSQCVLQCPEHLFGERSFILNCWCCSLQDKDQTLGFAGTGQALCHPATPPGHKLFLILFLLQQGFVLVVFWNVSLQVDCIIYEFWFGDWQSHSKNSHFLKERGWKNIIFKKGSLLGQPACSNKFKVLYFLWQRLFWWWIFFMCFCTVR